MSDFLVPGAYAVLVWWFTTGAILFLDGLSARTFRWSMAGATVVLIAALFNLRATAGDATVHGAYSAFTSSILVWGWLEMSFLMGFVTGPRTHACGERCSGLPHFFHAIQAILYNEMATACGAALIFFLTWHMPNQFALWTYVILWAMRVSAKLNLFFGVPNLGEKFLPAHLQYLRSFFRKRGMNILFPVSITASTVATVVLSSRYAAAIDTFERAGLALIISLLGLAVIEHWFMVLPLPSERLWSWASKPKRDARREPLERRIAANSP